MKVVIIEDDLIVADHLTMMLQRHGITVLGVIDNAEDAMQEWTDGADLYFVDIRLSGIKTGIDLGKVLHANNQAFVYVTANNEISTVKKAAETSPFGYITKTYKESDVVALLELFKVQFAREFEVNTDFGKKRIKLTDILYLEADGSYVKIFTKERLYTERGTLTEIEERYDSYFIRVHRSFLVNTDKIDEYNSKEVYVNGKAIPISRSYKDLLTKLK